MKTDFSKESMVGNLWKDMKDTCSASEEIEALEAEVDNGYITGLTLQNSACVDSNNGTIEAAEVMEFAYDHPKYHHLLAKNGFPVPFAMNDFREGTLADDLWRKRVVGEVDAAIAELGEKGISPFNAGYDLALTEKIFDRMKGIVASIEKDCRVEASDWEALENGCGACTEHSKIIYFALDYAGLDPEFLISFNAKPTLYAMATMTQYAGEGDSHALAGVTLAGGQKVYADLLGADEIYEAQSYPLYAESVTPRQFAALHLMNMAQNGIDKKEIHRLDLIASEILPDEIRYSIRPFYYKLETLKEDELEEEIAKLRSKHGESDVNELIIAILRYDYATITGKDVEMRKEKTDELLGIVSGTEPRLAAFNYYWEAEAIVTMGINKLEESLEKNLSETQRRSLERKIAKLKKEAYGLAKQSVMLNPLWFKSIQLLDKLAYEWLKNSRRVELYRQLIDAHPGHSHFRLQFGAASAECARAEMGASDPVNQCDNAAKIVDEGMAHLKAIAYKLEPDLAEAHLLLGSLALITNDQRLGIAEIEKSRALMGAIAEDNVNALTANIVLGMYKGDMNMAKHSIDRLEKLVPERLPKLLWDLFNYQPANYYLDADRKTLGSDELEKRLEVVEMVIDRTEKAANDPNKADVLRAAQAIILLMANYGATEMPDRIFKNIKEPLHENVQATLENMLHNAVHAPFSKSNFENGRFKEAIDITKFMEEKLEPSRKGLTIPVYMTIADRAIDRGKAEYAEDALSRALEIDAQKAADLYFDQICVRHFSAYLDKDAKKAEKAREFKLTWLAMEALWNVKEKLPPSTLDKMKSGYDVIADSLAKSGQKPKAKEATERMTELSNILDKR